MLVFVDESGDAGRKTNAGSSKFFIVTTVVFSDRDEAQKCDARISRLRIELGMSGQKEFHFNKDNHEVRSRFLSAVAEFDFQYSSLVLNKNGLTGPGFSVKESLYKYAVHLAFSNILGSLRDATVVFDRCGGREFGRQLKTYLRKKIRKQSANEPHQHLKKIRSEKSHTNNLLQMADMVCGAVARSYSGPPGKRQTYRRIIKHREFCIQVWPKLAP